MVRTVEKKYQIWLAGYYDDFNGARAIPDDENRPSDTTYSAIKSHFGSPMNGEAFLNPRFRFSVEERTDDAGLTTNNFIATDANRYLQNDGIFEWLTHDDTRLKRDEWEGKAQLQYPDGHIANRYKFDADSAYGTSFYQRFINGHNSDASYLVPVGVNDATFGRNETYEYTTSNYNLKQAGASAAAYQNKTFMQRAHLTGVFMGEVLALDATTPSDTTTPKNTFQEIYSPAKKPFLCIQSTRQNFNSNSPTTPTLIYDGPLNTRLDEDIFTARIALQSMMVTGAWSDIGVKFEVGFAASQAGLLSDTGYTGTAAIDFTLDLADISYDTSVYVGEATNDNMWIDVDFVFDYTNNKFRAYYNGTEITSTNATAGSYSSSAPKGYTMSGGSATTASNLYGYQITVTNETGTTGDNGYVSYLMLDRVGLVRYLTDDITTTEEVHIQSMKLNQTNNGMSVCEVKIADDPDLTGGVRGAASTDYVYNLRNLFVASAPLDWNLLIFADKTSRIDRPVWRGEISNFSIAQKDRSRIITLKAFDSLAYLDRQVPLWDVGQKGQNTSEDSTDYWTYDAQGFRNSMYLGADKLKLLDGNVGFDTDNSYKESSNQRTQLGSGHPIQMYNNEDTRGPNNIEDLYEGYGIIGITKDTSADTVLILQDSSHGITTSTSLNIDTGKHDASGVNPTAVSGAELTIASGDLAFTSESAKICYIGKYPSILEASYTDLYTTTGFVEGMSYDDHQTQSRWAFILANSPASDDFNLSANVTSLKTYVYFDADPNLKTDDTFYIARENQANSVNLTAGYTGEHKVLSVTKIRNYFNSFSANSPSSTLEYIWVVKTDTDYSGSESHGVYTTGNANTDTLLSGTGRFEWSNDKGQITNVQSNNMTAMQQRAIHAKWMKDLSNSLWFKYHFGVVKRASANDAPPFPQTGNITTAGKGARTNRISASQTISPTTTIIEIDEYAYDNAPNAGVAEIWATPDVAPATYPHATDYKEKFIYQGKVAVSGSPNRWYLVGAKYITGTYAIDASYNYSEDSVNKRLYLRFQDYEDSYKHIWLLWADMRNNGEANADGSQRKADFGLQYPTSNNYNVNLYFADQLDADGNLDMFGSLKIGEDLDIWNIDPRTEAISGGAFSKPVDFDNVINSGITFQENSSGDTKLRVVKSGHGFSTGDYVYIYNTNLHNGFYQIESAPSTAYFYLKAGTWKGSDTGLTGGIHIAPITGSGANGESTAYQDWEDKAGALLVIDTAKFFNLNTHANGGKTGQSAGGRTDLTDYVVESNGDRAGFPTLIDNYWTEATSTYQTTADQVRQHPNQNHLISSATNASRGFPDGFIGLPVADASEFAETGIGKLVAVMSQTDNKPNTITHYFHWDGKLETTYTAGGTITSVGTPFNHAGLTNNYPVGHVNYGQSSTIQVVTITRSGETHTTSGLARGMTIERTDSSGNITYHTITDVPSNTQLTITTEEIIGGTTITWATTDTYSVPKQLANVFILDESFLAEEDLAPDALPNLLNRLQRIKSMTYWGWDVLGINMNYGTTAGDENTPEAYEVHATVYSEYMLRLMMHIDGFYKAKNSGTYWDSDKIRMLWNAAIMDTWLPSARVNAVFDINNVPITKLMTTYNDTSSNDAYGSVVDSRGKTLNSIITDIQDKAGYGNTNGLYTSFSYLVGKDNRFEFRPKYNSGLVLNRDNMMISNIISELTGQITNVRVYYNNGAAFADWPATNLSDSTRWKIIEYPDITSGSEALLVAQQEYNKRKNTPLQLSATPILESDVDYKMIDSGRYGYIADPYIALGADGESGTDYRWANDWTRLGTGGVLFPGMVNALDGNMNIDMTDTQTRYGSSRDADGTTGNLTWKYNYYWYGSNSISNAIQIVHIPNKTPLVSDQTNEHLRIWVDLKNQTGTSIDEAEFVVTVADYSFSGTGRTATANSTKTKDVKHSGFYEIDFPDNYGAVANAKIVFSFNAEYCRALLRHRCGDPTQTAHGSANYILDSSVDNGSGSVNADSIFPLGKRPYTEMGGGFRDTGTNKRLIWYAPRIQICRDLSYTPATYASVTDAGLQLSSESMVIKEVRWDVAAGQTEEVNFKLERDESISADGILSYLFPNNNRAKQTGSDIGGVPGGGAGYQEPPYQGTPPLNPGDSLTDPFDQKPDGNTRPDEGDVFDSQHGSSLNELTPATYSALKGRMDLPMSGLSSNSKFSILAQDKPPITPTSMRGIEGMSVDIQATSGTATITADGYTFSGKGLMGGDAVADSQETSIETTFIIPTDVVSSKINVVANATHSPLVVSDTKAQLYVTATIKETGEQINNTVRVATGIKNQKISLIPLKVMKGLKESGNTVVVKITRKAGVGLDDANTTSVILNNLDVKLHRASAQTSSSSHQFSPPS